MRHDQTRMGDGDRGTEGAESDVDEHEAAVGSVEYAAPLGREIRKGGEHQDRSRDAETLADGSAWARVVRYDPRSPYSVEETDREDPDGSRGERSVHAGALRPGTRGRG